MSRSSCKSSSRTRFKPPTHSSRRLLKKGQENDVRIGRPEGRDDPRFHRRWRLAAGDGAGRVRQSRDADQVCRDGRLQRRAGHLRQAPRLPRQQGRRRPSRQGRGRSRSHTARIPRAGRRAGKFQGRRKSRRRHLQGRAEGGCFRHVAGQGLRRGDQAPSLLLQSRESRQFALDQQAGLDRDGTGSGPRVPGQAHGRPSGRRATHRSGPGGRARRRRAPTAPDKGFRSGESRPRHRRAADYQSDTGQGSVAQGGAVEGRNWSGQGGTRAQKGRSDVRHSHKKPWRQKGTGRARAGDVASPLWRGGGKIFPNSPDENFSQKVNRKMYRAGMCSILSQLAREERLKVVESFSVEAPKTKLLAQKLKQMGLTSTLVITDDLDQNLLLSSRNLINFHVLDVNHADPVSLIRFDNVILTKKAVARFEEILK